MTRREISSPADGAPIVCLRQEGGGAPGNMEVKRKGPFNCREAALKFDLCKKTQSATRPGPARPDRPLLALEIADLRTFVWLFLGPPCWC